MPSLTLTAIEGLPMVNRGDNLAELILRALDAMRLELRNGDILTVCQKIVSKSEGRVVSLKGIEPSAMARGAYHVTVAVPGLVGVRNCDVGRTGRVVFDGAPAGLIDALRPALW